METTNAGRSADYLELLLWLETASEDEIVGAYWLATGVTKEDMRVGIQSLIESDRPSLANRFPELGNAPFNNGKFVREVISECRALTTK